VCTSPRVCLSCWSEERAVEENFRHLFKGCEGILVPVRRESSFPGRDDC
jgi:hypothetical protein